MAISSSTEFVGGDAYAFVSDPASGLYRKGANTIGVIINGTEYTFSTTALTIPVPPLPSASGTTDIGATATRWRDLYLSGNVNAQGIVSGSSGNFSAVTSGNGFKSLLGPFTYFNSTYGGGTVNCVTPLLNTGAGTITSVVMTVPMPFAGSVMGVGCDYFGSTTVTTAVTVLKNGATLAGPTNIIASGGTFSNGTLTYAKGTNPFAAGDRLSVNVNFSIAGNCGVQLYLVVEMAA